MNATAIFQALSQAIFISIGQALIIYILTRLILSAFRDLSSSLRYNLLYSSLLLICIGFIIAFLTLYDPLNAVHKEIILSNENHSAEKLLAWSWALPYSYWIALLYLAGLILQTIFLIIGFYRLQSKRTKDLTPVSQFWTKRLEDLKQNLGIVQKISFNLSDKLLIPFTAGYLKPIILFPLAAMNQLSTAQVEAILLHELAHIKRNDYLMNIIQRVMEIILFFNPIIWVLAKQIKAEREYCCDNLVLEYTPDPLIYARALALMEEHRLTVISLAMAASGNRKHDLFTRIQKITNMKTQNSNPKHRLLALFAVLAIGLSIAWVIPADSTKVKAKQDTTAKTQNKSLKQPSDVPAPPPAPPAIKGHPAPVPPAPMHPSIQVPPALPAPPAKADTTELKKFFNSAEWKAQEKALEKAGKEISQYFDSPEWKSKVMAIEKNAAEIEKKFNSAEWKAHEKELEKHAAALAKQFSSAEWKSHVQELEKHSAELEKKFNSPEWKEKMKKLEENSLELEKKFNSPEWKAKMKNLEEKSKEMEKKFNSPEWKNKMKELEEKQEKQKSENLN